MGSTPILSKVAMTLRCPSANSGGTPMASHSSMSIPAGFSVARMQALAPRSACSTSHSNPASPRFLYETPAMWALSTGTSLSAPKTSPSATMSSRSFAAASPSPPASMDSCSFVKYNASPSQC